MERTFEIHPAEDSTAELRLPLKSVHLRERTNRVSHSATDLPHSTSHDRLPQFGLDGHGQENAEQSGDPVGTLVLIAPLGALESLTFRRLRGRNARAYLIVGISHECP